MNRATASIVDVLSGTVLKMGYAIVVVIALLLRI